LFIGALNVCDWIDNAKHCPCVGCGIFIFFLSLFKSEKFKLVLPYFHHMFYVVKHKIVVLQNFACGSMYFLTNWWCWNDF